MTRRRNDIPSWQRDSIIEQLVARDGNRCFYCRVDVWQGFGRGSLPTIDHKIPLSRGGSNELDNLALACYNCNKKKGSLTDSEFINTSHFQRSMEQNALRLAKAYRRSVRHINLWFNPDGSWGCECGTTGPKGQSPIDTPCALNPLAGSVERPERIHASMIA